MPGRKLPYRIAYTRPIEPGFASRSDQQTDGIAGVCGEKIRASSKTGGELLFKAVCSLAGCVKQWEDDSLGPLACCFEEATAPDTGAAEDKALESVLSDGGDKLCALLCGGDQDKSMCLSVHNFLHEPGVILLFGLEFQVVRRH